MDIPEYAENSFILCTFGMLGALASADGAVSRIEEKFVERFTKEKLNFDRARRKMALEIFREARQSPLEMRDYAKRFQKDLGDRIPLRDSVMEVLLALSVADGMLSEEEDKALRSTALLLDLSEQAYQGLKQKYIRPEQVVQ